jgi:hypothetical protein
MVLHPTQAPTPLHTDPLLSVHSVPCVESFVPHMLLVQVFVLQTVVCAAQSDTTAHPTTHLPEPSHTCPPLSEHAVPATALVVPHALPVQAAIRHSVFGAAQSAAL